MRTMRVMAGKKGMRRRKAYSLGDIEGCRDDLGGIIESLSGAIAKFRLLPGVSTVTIDGGDQFRQGLSLISMWVSRIDGAVADAGVPDRGQWVGEDIPEPAPNTRIPAAERRRLSDKKAKAESPQPTRK